MSQNLTLSAGAYTLAFKAEQRYNYQSSLQHLRVNLRATTPGIVTRRFVGAGNRIAEERDSTGVTVVKRFFAEGEQRIGGSDAGNYYYTRDHLGSIREITNASGTLKGRYDYDPYGGLSVSSGALNLDFGYTGHFNHQRSGLNLSMYRAYSPTFGRWISRDPLENAEMTQGPNLYAYVGNNTTNLTDPLGLEIDGFHTYFGWLPLPEFDAPTVIRGNSPVLDVAGAYVLGGGASVSVDANFRTDIRNITSGPGSYHHVLEDSFITGRERGNILSGILNVLRNFDYLVTVGGYKTNEEGFGFHDRFSFQGYNNLLLRLIGVQVLGDVFDEDDSDSNGLPQCK